MSECFFRVRQAVSPFAETLENDEFGKLDRYSIPDWRERILVTDSRSAWEKVLQSCEITVGTLSHEDQTLGLISGATGDTLTDTTLRLEWSSADSKSSCGHPLRDVCSTANFGLVVGHSRAVSPASTLGQDHGPIKSLLKTPGLFKSPKVPVFL
jgi:hypothetical protein